MIEAGALRFQRCENGHGWLPQRSHCPCCLTDRFGWETAGGGATLISWVVYRRAFHPDLEQRVPYDVALVELDEGPRMMSNVVGVGFDKLEPGMRLRVRIEREGKLELARFERASD